MSFIYPYRRVFDYVFFFLLSFCEQTPASEYNQDHSSIMWLPSAAENCFRNRVFDFEFYY
jgi:hypothetical protein